MTTESEKNYVTIKMEYRQWKSTGLQDLKWAVDILLIFAIIFLTREPIAS